ncbi:hypothetical protein GE061_005503 [Apolygus lucorum]|uniref:Uncharacterized protein n=1 Tax=Apolygus lucorum TaxID=248454 RepID=A0A8S9WZ41_APOLU|nr:hypothetical protein GE061_005503 [Apolygus lucorum]
MGDTEGGSEQDDVSFLRTRESFLTRTSQRERGKRLNPPPIRKARILNLVERKGRSFELFAGTVLYFNAVQKREIGGKKERKKDGAKERNFPKG